MKENGLLNKIIIFFREVREETAKVSWPGRKEAFRYTMIVVGSSVAVATLLGSFDYVLVEILRRFAF